MAVTIDHLIAGNQKLFCLAFDKSLFSYLTKVNFTLDFVRTIYGQNKEKKVIEELNHRLGIIEKILIETPEEMGSEDYEKLIEEAKQVRETLKFLKRL